jgi:hypothetical protein
MKECFVAFDFELKKYIKRDMNDGNLKRFFVISFFLAFGSL